MSPPPCAWSFVNLPGSRSSPTASCTCCRSDCTCPSSTCRSGTTAIVRPPVGGRCDGWSKEWRPTSCGDVLASTPCEAKKEESTCQHPWVHKLMLQVYLKIASALKIPSRRALFWPLRISFSWTFNFAAGHPAGAKLKDELR